VFNGITQIGTRSIAICIDIILAIFFFGYLAPKNYKEQDFLWRNNWKTILYCG